MLTVFVLTFNTQIIESYVICIDERIVMRTATINLRAMPNQRDLIDYAAELLGKSRSDFMLESACNNAKNVILDRTLFQLEEEKFNQFLTALEQPVDHHSMDKLFSIKAPWTE